MAKQKIKDIVAQELESFLAENGYELYNVEFVKEGKDWFLRVYADMAQDRQEEFISTDDCEKISRFLSERLDAMAPGMDREILTEAHYLRFTGRTVEVKLYQPVCGRKQIDGVLEGLTDGTVIITDENNQRWELPLDQIAKTKLAVVF